MYNTFTLLTSDFLIVTQISFTLTMRPSRPISKYSSGGNCVSAEGGTQK